MNNEAWKPSGAALMAALRAEGIVPKKGVEVVIDHANAGAINIIVDGVERVKIYEVFGSVQVAVRRELPGPEVKA